MASVSDDTGPSTSVGSTTSLILGTLSSLPTSRPTTQSGTSGAEYGVYTFFVVIGWITLIFGCGFIWTQFCKAFYLSSSMCENGTIHVEDRVRSRGCITPPLIDSISMESGVGRSRRGNPLNPVTSFQLLMTIIIMSPKKSPWQNCITPLRHPMTSHLLCQFRKCIARITTLWRRTYYANSVNALLASPSYDVALTMPIPRMHCPHHHRMTSHLLYANSVIYIL